MTLLVQAHREKILGNRIPAYDGGKSLFTAGSLPFESKDFVIVLKDDDEPGSSSSSSPTRCFFLKRVFDIFVLVIIIIIIIIIWSIAGYFLFLLGKNVNASIESPSGLLPELTFTTSVSFSGAVSWIVLMRLSRLLMLFCVLHRLKGRVYAIFNIIDACCLVGLILICCFLCLTDFFLPNNYLQSFLFSTF